MANALIPPEFKSLDSGAELDDLPRLPSPLSSALRVIGKQTEFFGERG
jgi:hypothetical protein